MYTILKSVTLLKWWRADPELLLEIAEFKFSNSWMPFRLVVDDVILVSLNVSLLLCVLHTLFAHTHTYKVSNEEHAKSFAKTAFIIICNYSATINKLHRFFTGDEEAQLKPQKCNSNIVSICHAIRSEWLTAKLQIKRGDFSLDLLHSFLSRVMWN